MPASQDQSMLSSTRGSGTTFNADSNSDAKSTSYNSAGSATAAGHGPHPDDHSKNDQMPAPNIGPSSDNLDGEQMTVLAEGAVMDAQKNKKNAGWGEQDSLTSDLDRKKAEQQGAREEIQAERQGGYNVDGGGAGRLGNEDLTQA